MVKFSVSAESLYLTLKSLNKVVPTTNSNLPILKNFLFDINDGILTITASDINNTLSNSLSIDSNGNGKICINAERIIKIIKELNNQIVTFSIDTNKYNVEITTLSYNAKYNIAGENADEYPDIPSLSQNKKNIIIPGNILYTGIRRTMFAISKDNIRPVMTGINFDIHDDEFCFVSTDAQKLSLYKNFEIKTDINDSIIITAETAYILKDALNKFEGYVNISFDDKNICFDFNNGFKAICKLLDGVFPNYKAVIPTNDKILIVKREELLSSIKRVRIFSNTYINEIRLSINTNSLTISSDDVTIGTSGTENIFCTYINEPMDIGFNAIHLIEILEHLDTENIEMQFSTPTRACLIKPNKDIQKDKKDDTIMLVMPILLNQ